VVVRVTHVVVRVLVKGLVGLHGAGRIHGIEILVGKVHWVGVEAREVWVKGHLENTLKVTCSWRKNEQKVVLNTDLVYDINIA